VAQCAESYKIHLALYSEAHSLVHRRNATADCAWDKGYLGIASGDLVGVFVQPHLVQLQKELQP